MNTFYSRFQKSFFLIAVLFVLSFGTFSFAEAQGVTTSPQSPQKAILVATVNVQDIKLLKQEGNVFTLSVNISNREGIQPSVLYAVDLFQKDSKGKMTLIDQKVYDNDILNLGTKDSVHKEISYTAPLYLKGTYTIMVEARNPDGLIFGRVQLREAVTLSGTNENIKIDQQSCYLTVDGEKGNKTYTLTQGVDISKEETLVAHCIITNTFKTAQTLTPIFQTRYRSTFGKIVGTEKQDPITLNSNQKIAFNLNLPKPIEPQAYDAILTFVDGNNMPISSSVDFHYVLRGASATIQNLITDKDYYLAGDTAMVSFYWSGSADGFYGSRLGGTDTGKATGATFIIIDDKNNSCAESLTQALSQGTTVEKVSIPITRECQNPIVFARIVDQNGKVLAENTYRIQSKNIPQTGLNSLLLNVMYVFVFLFVIALAVLLFAYVYKKQKRSSVALFFGLMIGLGLLTGGHEAKADTFDVITELDNPGHYVTTTFTLSLDKSTYLPGETIAADGLIINALCNNGMDILVLNEITGTLTTTINGTTDSIWYGTGYFTAQNTPGTYTAVFAANIIVTDAVTGEVFTNGVVTSEIPYTVGPTAINGSCGAADGQNYPSSRAGYGPDTQCSEGTSSDTSYPSPGDSVSWTCSGTNGGTDASCSASRQALAPVNGSCGSANTKNYPIAATGYSPDTQCSQGTSSDTSFPASGGSVSWTCSGLNGGTDASCAASRQASPINGVCGSASGQNYPPATAGYAPDTQCGAGTSSNTAFPVAGGTVLWNCVGLNGGTNASCSASRQPVAVNGSCGSADGRVFAASATGYSPYSQCSVGFVSDTSFPSLGGTASWICYGANGGTNASCSATRQVDGACGLANGNPSLIEPSSPTLCGAGSASAVGYNAGLNRWEWNCFGTFGGATSPLCVSKKGDFKIIQF